MQRDTGKLLFNSSSLHLSIWHLVDERQEKADNDPDTAKLCSPSLLQQQGQPGPWRDGSSLGEGSVPSGMCVLGLALPLPGPAAISTPAECRSQGTLFAGQCGCATGGGVSSRSGQREGTPGYSSLCSDGLGLP